MSINDYYIDVGDLKVQVIRKDIKNLHIAVYPPEGRVRVATPLHITDDNIRLAVISKLSWIRKQQTQFQDQPRQSDREMISGESHYLFGKRYRLKVIESFGKHKVEIRNNSTIELFVHANTTVENRKQVLTEWYRAELKKWEANLLIEPVLKETLPHCYHGN